MPAPGGVMVCVGRRDTLSVGHSSKFGVISKTEGAAVQIVFHALASPWSGKVLLGTASPRHAWYSLMGKPRIKSQIYCLIAV